MICAVIDDGVCVTKYPFLTQLAGSVAITEKGIVPAPPPDVCTHGTYCAAIIRQYAPETEIFSVRVMKPCSGQARLQDVREALAWCAEQPISVINLSIGSTSLREWSVLRPIIAKLCRKGIPLVCAWPNHDRFSVYAAHSWSISVQADKELRGDQYFPHRGGFFEADFFASSRHIFALSELKTEGLASENSHATPVVTAQICNLLKEQGSAPLGSTLRKLAAKNVPQSQFHLRMIPDFLDTVVTVGSPIYPENLWLFKSEQHITSGTIHSDKPLFLAVFPECLQESDITDLIRQKKDTLQGLLWAGVAPASIKNMVRETGCLFWDESEYQAKLSNSLTENCPAEVFKIDIVGEVYKAIQMTQSLQKELLGEGIRTISFSDLPQAYCLGMLYLPSQSDAEKIMNTVSCGLDLEIAIYCGKATEKSNDMGVSCQNGSFVLSYEGCKESCLTISETVHRIVDLLLQDENRGNL